MKSLLQVRNLYQPSTTLDLEAESIIHYNRPGSSVKRPKLKGDFAIFYFFYISLFPLCSSEGFLKKVAENLDFIRGQFSVPFSKIPSVMHYMNNKI